MSTLSIARRLLPWTAFLALARLAPAQNNIYICGDRDLPLVMQQVPRSWTEFGYNNDAMATYNRVMEIYRYIDSDGSYGQNGTSEFAGFPSSASLLSTWGVRWSPDDLALTLIRWSGTCGRISESDVAFNPSVSWTYDALAAETNPSQVYYLTALMHELGHTVGLMTREESYRYDQPSVMHAYVPGMVHPTYTLHTPEANLIRRQYSDQTAIRSMDDMAVFSHWASGGLHNSYTDRYSYSAGDRMVVNNLTIENTGSRNLSQVHLRLYLSTDRSLSSTDPQLGDWVFGSFPKEAFGVYDFTVDLPTSLSQGTYYVLAKVSSNGYGSDDNGANDTTRLFSSVSIQRSCAADRFEPNDGGTSATPVVDATYTGLRICSGDQDWFVVPVAAGQALDMEVQFSHSSGDIDARLYDPDMNEIDSSLGTSDSERVGFSSAPRSGPYFLQVFGIGSMDNGYTLNVDLAGSGNQGGGNGGSGGSGGGGGGGACRVAPLSGPSNMREALAAAWWMILVLVVTGWRARRSASMQIAGAR